MPKEKVNTRLVCKKCLRVFHVTPAGNTVLGEPAAAQGRPQSPADRTATSSSARYGRALRRVDVKTLQDSASPGPADDLGIDRRRRACSRRFGYWFFFYKQSLATRTETIARAIIKSDMKTVDRSSAPGTEMDTIRWYNDVYKALYGSQAGTGRRRRPGSQSSSRRGRRAGERGSTWCSRRTGLRFDGSLFNDALSPNPSLSNSKQSLEVPLFWVKDLLGNWLLDGTKTFSAKPGSP